MKVVVREVKLPQDYPYIAEVLNTCLPEPITAQDLELDDSKIPSQGHLYLDENKLLAGFDRYVIVAVDAADIPIAYGISWRAPWTAHGELNHRLVVDPRYRHMGIGQEVYHHLEQWAHSIGASKLNYEIRDEDDSALQFATQLGFKIKRHVFESVLDLSTFKLEEYLPGISKVEETGVVITSLEKLDGEIALKEQALYELYRDTSYDIPGFSGEYFDQKEWKKWTLDLPGSSPKYLFVAIENNQWVGVAHVLYKEATSSFYHEFTGVRSSYRGRGIAQALKIKSIEAALEKQPQYMRTNNDSMNTPMLKINRDYLGFRAVPGLYVLAKNI